MSGHIAPWRRWLCRNETHCNLCVARNAADPARYPVKWSKVFGPSEALNPVNPATAPAYWAATRRAFEAHVLIEHSSSFALVFGGKPVQ